MEPCKYIYCARLLAPGSERCSSCGHPADAARLADERFLADAAAELGRARIIDMHQILLGAEPLALQLGMMDRLGIEKVLVQAVPSAFSSIWGNDRLLALRQEHPGRFWISQFSDPRLPDAREQLRRCADLGIKVIKLVPSAGYRPDDAAWEPYFGAMAEHGLVAMVHTGFITARHKREERAMGIYFSSDHSRPIYWDRVARMFPTLPIILCHMGSALWYEEAAMMVTHHDNVWGDVSAFGLFALERILKSDVVVDPAKLMWGNDSSWRNYPFSLRRLRDILAGASRSEWLGPLLHDNARRFAGQFLE
jgi:predicted TIM-barrel fold metal-dependent hydrolase